MLCLHLVYAAPMWPICYCRFKYWEYNFMTTAQTLSAKKPAPKDTNNHQMFPIKKTHNIKRERWIMACSQILPQPSLLRSTIDLFAELQNPLCAATPLRLRAKTMKVVIHEPHCYSSLHWGHSQIRLSAAVETLAEALQGCLSLCWLRKRVYRKALWAALLYDMKLNWDDRVVFSGA